MKSAPRVSLLLVCAGLLILGLQALLQSIKVPDELLESGPSPTVSQDADPVSRADNLIEDSKNNHLYHMPPCTGMQGIPASRFLGKNAQKQYETF